MEITEYDLYPNFQDGKIGDIYVNWQNEQTGEVRTQIYRTLIRDGASDIDLLWRLSRAISSQLVGGSEGAADIFAEIQSGGYTIVFDEELLQ